MTSPIPMLLWCPECRARHIDVGEFVTKVHHTHACQTCGVVWRPAVEPTVGVQFLPSFKNDPVKADLNKAEVLLGMTREELATKMLPLVQPVFEELERYKAAVEVAREKGEHYPTCNMPPPHLRTVGDPSEPEYKAWREASRGKCDCWKAQMEAKLR